MSGRVASGIGPARRSLHHVRADGVARIEGLADPLIPCPARDEFPRISTTAFLNGLKQVDGWKDMPLTQAAQTVQVSAYPDHYAQWEKQAADLVAELWSK
ncbi:hypothetical protein [Micromonospora pallida]|uniref:hypothetical protein n=1 Tax=Micromonospora pallida TaxID=145854 RepID=UPI000B8941C8|nr:hypothetical protein [Micromonospora pallida]